MINNKLIAEFIPYAEALALKELGFNESCFGYYGVENKLHIEVSSNLDSNLTRRNFITAPTFSQAFRWFREKHELHSYFYRTNDLKSIMYTIDGGSFTEQSWFDTYEKAEFKCLNKLIEITKNKK